MSAQLSFIMLQSSSSEESWKQLFREQNIKDVFYQKILPKGGQGVDRISVAKFEKIINEQTSIISRKCLAGTYKFSPYLEQLISKGRGREPRVISIPTVRDKIVLKILTEFLHEHFNDYLAKDLPNTVIKNIKEKISDGTTSTGYIQLDLESFYDSIVHEKILDVLATQIGHPPFVRLVRRALCNPTLPAGYSGEKRKLSKNTLGIPQGLSISNILAEIYVDPLDSKIQPLSKAYFRFVDDIFILCDKENLSTIWKAVNKATKELILKINKDKSTPDGEVRDIQKGFEFLGYHFKTDKISVRENSYNRFVQSVIGRIIKYKHSLGRENAQPAELTKQVFIEDLNERITGAIDENRRYGWVFFFSEIDDIKLLQKIDMVIQQTIKRLPNFSKEDQKKIKRVTRAYYEANHSPKRGYIHDYNKYKTIEQKLEYLEKRGITKEGAQYTEGKVNQMFAKAKAKNLLKLEKDVGKLS